MGELSHGPVRAPLEEDRPGTPADAATEGPSCVVLVGRPNVGKSAVFGALTRHYVTVSNYPGTTVEITRGKAGINGKAVPVVDTPGIRSFVPSSLDERVTRDILLQSSGLASVVVGDAKDMVGTLALTLQLAEMGLPFVLCLNMVDEANDRALRIDAEELSASLGVDVVETVAIRHQGIPRLLSAIEGPRRSALRVQYPPEIEKAVARLVGVMPDVTVSRRALAVMLLEGDASLEAWLEDRLSPSALATIRQVRRELRRCIDEPVPYLVNRACLGQAEELARSTVQRASRPARRRRLASHLERLTIHPVWSLPILAVVLYVAYLFVGKFGAGTLVDLLETQVFERWVNPTVTRLVDFLVPFEVVKAVLVGPYGIFTMALTYALALIFPIVATFFIAFGVLEDSGYLPRLAVVLNRAFSKIGLNGKAVLPMVLGLGCDTMATLTTRILETRKERLIVIILLSLGVPCSAQLAVIVAMLGSISMLAVVAWAAVMLGVIVLVGALAARVLPGRSSDFIEELPPMRMPRLSNILLKTTGRIEWYLKEAVPLFVLGTLILFIGDRVGLLEVLRRATEPIVAGWLGLPTETAEAFIVGFLRRDFGAAGLYNMNEAGLLDGVQVLVAAVTITLFVPCIAHFFMTVKERGWRVGLAIATFVFAFALVAGGALNWLLRLTGVSLG